MSDDKSDEPIRRLLDDFMAKHARKPAVNPYDLSRCPFCGSDQVREESESGTVVELCEKCGARGPVAASAREAIDLWNTRRVPHRE